MTTTTALTAATCRICPAPATTRVEYVVEHNGARVEHLTCDRHTQPLLDDMVAAGWVPERESAMSDPAGSATRTGSGRPETARTATTS